MILRRVMSATSLSPKDPASNGAGVSRRALLSRSAAGVGIALAGNVTGLFGSGTAAAAPRGASGAPAKGRS